MIDDDFLILVNAWWEPLTFTIPVTRAPQTETQAAPSGPAAGDQVWRAELNTYLPAAASSAPEVHAGSQVTVSPRSIVVLRAPGGS